MDRSGGRRGVRVPRALSFDQGGAWRRLGVALGIAGAVAWAGCGRGEPAPPVSLAELFPGADKHLETRTVLPADSGSAAHLLEGWSQSGRRGPEPFAWGTGMRSVVGLTIVEPRPLVLELRGWPHRFPGAPLQVVEVALNGHSLEHLEMGVTWRPRSYRVELPAESQSIGLNRLELHYTYSARPRETRTGRTDGRRLAAAWSGFELRGARRAPAPATAGRDLLLPVRTGVSFLLPSSEGGELSIARVSAWRGKQHRAGGAEALRLRVQIDRPDGAPGESHELEAGGEGPHGLALPASAAPLRVTLAALAGDARPRALSGLRIHDPWVRPP